MSRPGGILQAIRAFWRTLLAGCPRGHSGATQRALRFRSITGIENETHKFRKAVRADFLHDFGAAVFDRAATDIERLGNARVVGALHEQVEHFDLGLGELRESYFELISPCECRALLIVSGHRGLNGLENGNFADRLLLQKGDDQATLISTYDGRNIGIACEDDDRRRDTAFGKFLEHGKARDLRHFQVEDQAPVQSVIRLLE